MKHFYGVHDRCSASTFPWIHVCNQWIFVGSHSSDHLSNYPFFLHHPSSTVLLNVWNRLKRVHISHIVFDRQYHRVFFVCVQPNTTTYYSSRCHQPDFDLPLKKISHSPLMNLIAMSFFFAWNSRLASNSRASHDLNALLNWCEIDTSNTTAWPIVVACQSRLANWNKPVGIQWRLLTLSFILTARDFIDEIRNCNWQSFFEFSLNLSRYKLPSKKTTLKCDITKQLHQF